MNPSQKTQQVCKNKLLDLLAKDAYRHGEFILASGKQSSHYVNCKPVSLSGPGLDLISSLFLDLIDPESCAVAGLTLGADPLVSGVVMAANHAGRSLNALIVRKEAKGHGTGSWLEGPLPPKGSILTVLEDVVTTGGSSIKAVKRLRDFGYEVKRVIAIVDRQEGADLAMKNLGLQLDSLFLLNDVADRSLELIK